MVILYIQPPDMASPFASEWAFTWHIKSAADVPKFCEERAKYCVYQKEICPKSGQPHWQGFVLLRRNGRRGGAQRAIGAPKWVHMNPRYKHSSAEKAAGYCMKAETRAAGTQLEVGPFEFGDLKFEPGKRSDLEAAVDCKTVDEVKAQYPTTYVKFNRGLEKLLVPKHDLDIKPTVCVLWGAGCDTGKSIAWKKFAKKYSLDHYWKDQSQWWDGYSGQPLLIIEDFVPSDQKWCTGGLFKTLFDFGTGYVYQKGQTRQQMVSKMVIFTSNSDPKSWWPSERWPVIEKRIKKIVHCGDEDFKMGNWLPAVEECMDGLCSPLIGPADAGPDPARPQPAPQAMVEPDRLEDNVDLDEIICLDEDDWLHSLD